MSDMLLRMTPPRFHGVTFENYVPHTPSQIQAAQAVWAWVESAVAGKGPMLALVGKQGTGKSHLLYSALGEILTNRPRPGGAAPYVAPWYRLSDELRYGRSARTENGTRQLEPVEVRAGMWERRISMLDEIRPTSGTNFDDTELAKFACHAYDNRIAVLVTTNWNPLHTVMGEAAASRFAQVVIDGPDARQENAA